MPKLHITVPSPTSREDGTDAQGDASVALARKRFQEDLIKIEFTKMYINEKKQKQTMAYMLWRSDWYLTNKSIIDIIE